MQTLLMMFIRVALEAFLSPNDLMLKAPSKRELERCSRARKRPKAHSKRILCQWGPTKEKEKKRLDIFSLSGFHMLIVQH